jgi:hypothetical protein
MVRNVTRDRRRDRRALLAVGVGCLALLWHLLACRESPMTFSPSGEDLAFTTVTFHGEDESFYPGEQTSRVMLLAGRSELRTMEESTTHMLSAPCFSPDGKRLGYLRVPLLDREEVEAAKERLGAARSSETALPAQDRCLPGLENAAKFLQQAAAAPRLPVELVVRDISSGEVLTRATRELPMAAATDPDGGTLITYALTSPRYGPDGHVYAGLNDLVLGIQPETGDWRLLAAPGALGLLAPDGRTLAFIQDDTIGFITTDGGRAAYRRWPHGVCPAGLGWLDDRTLVLLRHPQEGQPLTLDLVASDGAHLRTDQLHLEGVDRSAFDEESELAIAPDGKHLVLGAGSRVLFLDHRSQVLDTWQDEGHELVRPVFAPDSSAVAFKRRPTEKTAGLDAIVLFTPDGKEVSSIPVPEVSPPEDR